jgi:hypothetical protein
MEGEMAITQTSLLILTVAAAGMGSALALESGRAKGTLAVDKTTTTLAYATHSTVPGLFDEKKKDTIVVLSDRPLGDIAPDDAVELHLQARNGKLVALALRLDGTKLVNVGVHAAGLDGVIVLPGQWFTYRASGPGAGALTLAKRDSDGHSYACTVEFNAAAAKPVPQEVAKPTPTVAPTPTLPPASTSSIDPKAHVAMIVTAMMQKDEDQALKLIKIGVDPNAKDQYGTPLLNWSVMMCMPKLVKELVNRGANLKYERAPGMTIMQEAGACPEAAKILKAAGAR